MKNQSISHPEALSPIVTFGSVLAVFLINFIILWYAVSISVPHEVAFPAVLAGTEGEGRTIMRSGKAGSQGAGISDESDDALYDLDEFEDWEEEIIEVVNLIDLPDPETTHRLFGTHCASCHGSGGEGDGPAAEYLLPRPRDFIGSPFRYATRGGNRNQVILDLQRIITQGVPRSAMPGFGDVLSEPSIAGLARYVEKIREEAEGGFYEEATVAVGMRPPWTPAMVARGRELFTSLACNTCHGDGGRGDGINAASLVDMLEKPVRPADLTSGLFKTGQNPEDLVQTIMKGVPGTPMIAYELALTQENEDETVNVMDAWALVSFIRSLRVTPQPPGRPSGAEILVESTSDESILTDPAHIAWLGIEPTLVSIKPLLQREEHTTFIEVRAVLYSDQLAICVDWGDESLDLQRNRDLYPDAVAVMFGSSEEVPVVPLGLEVDTPEDDVPIHVWHWAADRHYEITVGHSGTPEDREAAKAREWYLFQSEGRGEDRKGSNRSGTGGIEVRAVIEKLAYGIGAPKDQESANVSASAVWSRGLWRVIFVRSLGVDNGLGVQFTPGIRLPISFGVWNGAKGDNGGNKLLSGWHWLKMEK